MRGAEARARERVHQAVSAFGDRVDVEREEQPSVRGGVAPQHLQRRAVVVRREVGEHREEADDVERAARDRELGRRGDGSAARGCTARRRRPSRRYSNRGSSTVALQELDHLAIDVDADVPLHRRVVVQQRLGELHAAADIEDVARSEIADPEVRAHVLDRADGRSDRFVFVLALPAPGTRSGPAARCPAISGRRARGRPGRRCSRRLPAWRRPTVRGSRTVRRRRRPGLRSQDA